MQTPDLTLATPTLSCGSFGFCARSPRSQRLKLWTQGVLQPNLWAGSWRQGEGEVYGVQRTLGPYVLGWEHRRLDSGMLGARQDMGAVAGLAGAGG